MVAGSSSEFSRYVSVQVARRAIRRFILRSFARFALFRLVGRPSCVAFTSKTFIGVRLWTSELAPVERRDFGVGTGPPLVRLGAFALTRQTRLRM